MSLQGINMPITWCNASSKGDGCKIRYGSSKLGPDFEVRFPPLKTKMTGWKTQPFEDAFPIGMCGLSYVMLVFTGVCVSFFVCLVFVSLPEKEGSAVSINET